METGSRGSYPGVPSSALWHETERRLVQLPRLPLGDAVEALVDWIEDYCSGLLDAISAGLQFLVDGLQNILLFVPAPVLILLITVLVWFVTRRDTRLAAITALGLLLIWNLELWDLSMLTLALVITSTVLALAIAIPLGIASARSEPLNAALRPVLDFMQTMPSFVYLIPAVIFFGLGSVPAIIATVIFAMPPALRLTNLGIRQVPAELIEVADAFGTTPRQKLIKVQLPVALPTIMAGVNQCIMLALSMTVIASMIGAGGLGYQVLVGIQRVDIGMGFEAGLAIVIIAVILDRITQNVVPPQQEDR
jgi:glycine betaine/proline transport system permease protein